MSDFSGFPPGTFQFLSDLEDNNTRDWFQANKQRYEQYFLEPALSFIKAMQKPLEKTAPLLKAEPKKVGGSMMRIYKDTRFSKDKTPYKTNIGIQFRHLNGSDVHAPGIYLHITTDECFLGAGTWRPPSDALKLIRAYLDENPDAWKKVLRSKVFNRSFDLYDDRLKSAPRGYAKDHPQIESLRLKSFIGMAPIKRAQLRKATFVTEAQKMIKDAAPLMYFLCEATGQPY